MQLTGKAKESFEKWFELNIVTRGNVHTVYMFNMLNESMRFGVYVDWLDTVGIYITDGTGRYSLKKHYFYYFIELFGLRGGHEDIDTEETRLESRRKSIEKSNELYNNR